MASTVVVTTIVESAAAGWATAYQPVRMTSPAAIKPIKRCFISETPFDLKLTQVL
jgi:hypothetical protein